MATNPPDERLLTVVEVAERWRVSPMTVYRLVREGHLQAFKIGNRFRINPSSVRAYEARHRTT